MAHALAVFREQCKHTQSWITHLYYSPRKEVCACHSHCSGGGDAPNCVCVHPCMCICVCTPVCVSENSLGFGCLLTLCKQPGLQFIHSVTHIDPEGIVDCLPDNCMSLVDQ